MYEHESRPDLRQKKYIQMTTMPVEKLVTKLALPTIASMLVTALYNMADTYFVSSVGSGSDGTNAIAAVSLAFSVMAIIQAFGFFIGQGSANYISRALGGQDTEKASEMAATGLFCALVVGLVITLVGELLLEQIAWLLGAHDRALLAPATEYLRWIFAAAPVMTCSFCLNNQLRFQGNAVYAMIGVVSGALLNVGLDPLLIHRFGMGVEGASVATCISQSVGFCILLGGTFRGDNLRIHPRRIRINRENLSQIARGGLPSLLRQGFNSVSVMVLNLAAGQVGAAMPHMGEAAVIAAFGLVSKIMTVANFVAIGMGQGYQPVCGFNYGAGLYRRVKNAFWFLVKASFVWCALVTLAGELGAKQILGLFSDTEEKVRLLSEQILRLQCATFLVNCWVMPANMTQQTIGWSKSASVLAAARQGMFLIPLVLVLPRFFGLTGLELCQPISDLLTLFLAIPLQAAVLRHFRQAEAARLQEVQP